MTAHALLSTHGLRLTAGDKTLCRDFNWQLQAGQSWALMGLNGAGKTTLLHTLAGLHTPDQGEVRLHDRAITAWPRREIAQHIGVLFQESDSLFPGTVLEHVLMGRHPHLKAWQWETPNDVQLARRALETVGLSELTERDMHTLSGGEAQRVAIATVLAQQPRMLLLDEPVNHLDWHHQHQILNILSGLVQAGSNSMVMAVHDVNLAARYCDHVILMFAGGETLTGTSKDLLTEQHLSRLYGYPVERIEHAGESLFIPG